MKTLTHEYFWLTGIICSAAVFSSWSADSQTARAEVSEWVMSYYQHPDPEHFVERVQTMSKAGVLHDPRPNARPDSNVMFLGKIMAANPSKLQKWLDALVALPADEQTVLKRAAWYSGTVEGNAWLDKHGESALAKGPRPLLLSDQQAMNLQPHHLDSLWEWFFATGEEQPIARIVSLFSLAHEQPIKDSFNLLQPPAKPQPLSASKSDEKQPLSGGVSTADAGMLYQVRMYNYQILQPAMWSCTSLATDQDRVLEILKKMERSHYHKGIKEWLAQIIKIAEAERKKKKE